MFGVKFKERTWNSQLFHQYLILHRQKYHRDWQESQRLIDLARQRCSLNQKAISCGCRLIPLLVLGIFFILTGIFQNLANVFHENGFLSNLLLSYYKAQR